MSRQRFAVGAAPDPFAAHLFRAASTDPTGAAMFALGVATCLAPVLPDVPSACAKGVHRGPVRQVGWYDRCEHCGERVTP